MTFTDRVLNCVDCGMEFVFSAAEQSFFHDMEFKNDPKHCKPCTAKRKLGRRAVRFESQVNCAACGLETVVPFRPFQGKPVYCRDCFQKARQPAA